MAHRGQGSPYFFWRDMCGELYQGANYSPRRNMKFQQYGTHSTLADWLQAHQPVSYQCIRVDWEQFLYYEWDLAGTGAPALYMRFECEWFPDERQIRNLFVIEWLHGGAEASKVWQQPPQIKPISGFTLPMNWDSSSTSDASIWSWGSGNIQTRLQMQDAAYGEEPDPP